MGCCGGEGGGQRLLPCITFIGVGGGQLTSHDLLYRAGQRLRRRVIAQSVRECKTGAETGRNFFHLLVVLYYFPQGFNSVCIYIAFYLI